MPTLLTVIGEEPCEVFSTFTDWVVEGDEAKIEPVPRKNMPFERYPVNRRAQEAGETYYRLVFGIKDGKVRERLLHELDLSLRKTDEICRAAESMIAQMKVVGDNSDVTVSAVKTKKKDHLKSSQDKRKTSKRTSSDGKYA